MNSWGEVDMVRRASWTTSRRWMTFAVVVGILFGSDARANHLAHCTKAADLCDVAAEPAAAEDDCCPVPLARTLEGTPDLCFALDDCSCCEHTPDGHLGEGDARPLFESDPGPCHGLLAVLSAPATLEAPRAPARAIPMPDRPLPAAPTFLLLGHLLI